MKFLSVRDLRAKSAVRMVSSGELILSFDARILAEYEEVLI